MNILHIAFYTFKRNVRSPKFFISMVCSPLLLILILGISLSSIFNSSSFENVKIGVYSTNYKEFVDFQNFTKSQNLNKALIVERINSKTQGISEVKTGDRDAVVCIEDSLDSTKLINTYVYKSDNFNASIVENLVNSYKNNTTKHVNYSYLEKNSINGSGKSPRAIDYYAVTMMVMMIMYASEGCIRLLNEDLFTDVKHRVKSLPIKTMDNIIGKILGCTFSNFVLSMCVILVTMFVYQVNWGNNIIFIFLIIFLFSFFSVNLGVSIFFIFKNSEAATYIVQAMVPIFTLLSGGYVQIDYFGEGLEKLSNLSPNYAVQNIIFNHIYRGYCDNVKVYYLELTALLIITFAIVLILGRRTVK